MPQINSLVNDIYKRLDRDEHIAPENVQKFAENLANKISERLGEKEAHRGLRLSNIGTPCDRKLWYTVNKPETAEPLRPEVKLKFLYGDIQEELLLMLAREAGHEVKGEQDRLEIQGVKGHRDAVIDGRLVDVKSASSRGFQKFKEHKVPEDDPFGYMDQINAYHYASDDVEDDLVTFFVIDKQMGHLTTDTYKTNGKDYDKFIAEKKDIVNQPDPPPRAFNDVPEGKSGNKKLSTECSYCPFKYECWPGLRTFLYSRGPVFLTKVTKEPNVKEAA